MIRIRVIVLKTTGETAKVLEADNILLGQGLWLAREIITFMQRTLKRVDLTGALFAASKPQRGRGIVFELAIAATAYSSTIRISRTRRLGTMTPPSRDGATGKAGPLP